MRRWRIAELREPLQMVTYRAWIGPKCDVASQQVGQFRTGEQIDELGVPERAIRADEICRQEDGRWEIVLAKDRKGEIVVVAPAVVEGDDAARTGSRPVLVSHREQAGKGDNIEMFPEKGELTLEGGDRHHHSWLRIIQSPIPLFDHPVVGEDNRGAALPPHPQSPIPTPCPDEGVSQESLNETLSGNVHDFSG